jgi:beta-1,4-mannosyltransferase
MSRSSPSPIREGAPKQHFVVLVLGDVGRSPRMQYHTVSLADMPGATVSLVGYTGEKCIAAVEDHPGITKHLIAPGIGKKWPRSLFLVAAPIKVLQQVFQLLWLLCVTINKPDAILVQNPPAIPVLAVVWLVKLIRGCLVVVDWHNLGYTILAENNLSRGHPVVFIAKWYERLFGQLLDAHLCVTKSFQGWLEAEWGISAAVLYDKPPAFFCRTGMELRHELFTRLKPEFADAEVKAFGRAAKAGETLFTRKAAGGKIEPHPDRPALLISSTSWTPDEDFGLLFDALVMLDQSWTAGRRIKLDGSKGGGGESFPHLVVVVTGKGPQRAMYEARIAEMSLKHVTIKTMWLEQADYPLLLGSADLGVCLHTSTSNLDLPMKVVDMFGCGLPVCAVHFDCLDELVVHNHNGLVFKEREELAEQLEMLLHSFPTTSSGGGGGDESMLHSLGEGVKDFQACRWKDNWEECAQPIFEQGSVGRPWAQLLAFATALGCVGWMLCWLGGLLLL